VLDLNPSDWDQVSSRMNPNRLEIEALRGPKAVLDPRRASGMIREIEATGPAGRCRATDQLQPPTVADVLSLFLTGAECAFRCVMCDLWKHTLDQPTQVGAIAEQVRHAIAAQPPSRLTSPASPRWIKLYNSSNFFDPRCVPSEDWQEIAAATSTFERVIVENHPKLVGKEVGHFAAMINGQLEVAMGLETVFKPSLQLLNKQMTLDDFQQASARLRAMNCDLRVFILIQPPGILPSDALEWALASLHFAQQCGARHVSLIPTRGGNGIMESLAKQGRFEPPNANCVEDCFDQAMAMADSTVVTVDLWDFDKLSGLCDDCYGLRRTRLEAMNLTQMILPKLLLDCECCNG